MNFSEAQRIDKFLMDFKPATQQRETTLNDIISNGTDILNYSPKLNTDINKKLYNKEHNESEDSDDQRRISLFKFEAELNFDEKDLCKTTDDSKRRPTINV